MHSPLVSFLAVALLASSSAHVFAATDRPPSVEKPSAAATLQVQVIVPPTWQPMLEDDIAREFVDRIDEVFRRRGYQGQIKEVTSPDEPSPGCCLLTLNLTEWRIDPIGNITCTFVANLQTGRTTRQLGLFTETAFRWMHGPGRFGLADAAESAIRQLYERLAQTGLVPGLRQR